MCKKEGITSYKVQNSKVKHSIFFSTFFLILAFTSFETNNKYKVQNSLGQQIYFAAEGNCFSKIANSFF
jgi:hypothetical protein